MQFLIFLAILAAVVVFLTRPLMRPPEGRSRGRTSASAAEVADLEAAREAKYRELRDAELDYRTGKLSTSDYEAIDRSLRAEAVEILRALDQARGTEAEEPAIEAGSHR
jgi:hypothetical protein